MKEVIVTGGRDYSDKVTLNSVLDLIDPDVVIQGGASGADKLAKEWAESHEKTCFTHEADWNRHGKAAGPIRNREMLKEYSSATVVAFRGGKGTADCVMAALQKDMIVLQVHK
jgi:hypothetical protein